MDGNVHNYAVNAYGVTLEESVTYEDANTHQNVTLVLKDYEVDNRGRTLREYGTRNNNAAAGTVGWPVTISSYDAFNRVSSQIKPGTAILASNAASQKNLEEAKKALAKDLDPPADLYNSSATKLHLARVLLERAWPALSA